MTSTKYKQLSILLVIIGFFVGFFTIVQFRSFELAENSIRDTNANNIFREVQVLKLTNDELKEEIVELTAQLESLTDGQSYRESIRSELEKNQLITGLTAVKGPGVTITLDQEIGVSWLVDMQNELWTAGAEAVSINGIRISPYTVGFKNFGSQLYLNNVPLRVPYKIETIGNTELLEKVLTQQGSISARLTSTYPELTMDVVSNEHIEMEAVR